MKLFRKIVLFSCLLILNSCAYLDVKMPLDEDVSTTKLGSKVGVSSMYSILWLIAWGDAGTEAAAKNGGINTINHLDMRAYQILFGLYTRRDTIAYGD